MIIALFILGCLLAIGVIGSIIVTYIFHVLTAIANEGRWAYGSYKDFMKIVNQYGLVYSKELLSESLVNNNYGIDIDSLAYRFDRIYMVTDPISFIRIEIYIDKEFKKHKKEIRKQNTKKVMWRE